MQEYFRYVVTHYLPKQTVELSVISWIVSFPKKSPNSLALWERTFEFESRAGDFKIFTFSTNFLTYFWLNIVKFENSKPVKVFQL